MRIQPDPFDPDADLPEQADVVIIGGGIIGAACALSLADKGVSVALCEKGVMGGEQSGRNWGWCRAMGRDPAELPLAIESVRLWRGMNERVGAETGFRQAGTMYLADTPADLAEQAQWLDHARQYQLDCRVLTPAQVEEVLPGGRRPWAGGLHTPSDGRAEPFKAVPAIAAAARRAGATILTNCAVRGVERSAGRVAAVVTERGRIRCSAVVMAGGAWSRLFCGNLGIDVPQLKLLLSVLRTTPVEGPDCAAGASDFAFRRRLDGGYTIARRNAAVAQVVPDSFRLLGDFLPTLRKGFREFRIRAGRAFFEELALKRRWSLDEPTVFEQVRTLDPEPGEALNQDGLRRARAAYPFLEGAQIAGSWGGVVDATPDEVPIIGEIDALPGFFLATGFSGHGFGIGPGAGQLVADIVRGVSNPIVDPAPFSPRRFRRLRKAAV